MPLPSVHALLGRRLPEPPVALRRGPLRLPEQEEPPHDARTAALLGRSLGIAFGICFLTGVVSHLHQHPPDWLALPSRPVWGYRVSQGLHVVTGIASVPLLLAKLWTVYRRLFAWPPARDVGHALERLLLVPLVAGALFELVSGLMNIVQWYPWGFFFPAAHWAVAWIVVGAMLVHLGLKAPLARSVTGEQVTGGQATGGQVAVAPGSPDRRAVLVGTGVAVAAVTLATAGQTVGPLRGVSVLGPRDPAVGPQGLPVNRTATAAGVTTSARDPGWRLDVAGPRPLSLSLADLARLPQRRARLPIACVEGWSATALWTGVRLADVLDLAGIDPAARLEVFSLERGGLYARSPLGPSAARDPLTLLATGIESGGSPEPLALDHGYPLRLIAPNRPGVQQTKWLSRIEVVR